MSVETIEDIIEKGGGIPSGSLLEDRLEFFGCKAAVRQILQFALL